MGTHPIFESDFDCLTDMEEFTDWLTERTVGLTSVIGLSGSTFDISDRILVISLLVTLAAIHITLWFMASGSESAKEEHYHNLTSKQREQILALMKERIELANNPSAQKGNVEFDAAEREHKTILENLASKKNEHEAAKEHAQSVQLKEQNLKQELETVTARYQELYNSKYYKEQELYNEQAALQAHEADDDSMTSHLEDSKREMDKLRDEINQIKKMINSKTKETNKLRTQLEKISKERDQAQAKIGKNLDKLSYSKWILNSLVLYLLGTLNRYKVIKIFRKYTK